MALTKNHLGARAAYAVAIARAANLAAAAFLAEGREKLHDEQAVNEITPKTKKKAELSLGQVQQGGMKQQERTRLLLHSGVYTYG